MGALITNRIQIVDNQCDYTGKADLSHDGTKEQFIPWLMTKSERSVSSHFKCRVVLHYGLLYRAHTISLELNNGQTTYWTGAQISLKVFIGVQKHLIGTELTI